MGIKKLKLAIIDYLIPPGLWRWHVNRHRKYGIMRAYRDWEDAKTNSSGYDSPAVIAKVAAAALEVKCGNAAYERDGTHYDTIRYSWYLLASLLWAASQNNNRLHILDFGGALGTSYFQNRKFLSHLTELRWDIVEQPKFYEIGKQKFEDGHLRFFSSIKAYSNTNRPDLALLSSSMQYVEQPYLVLEEILTLHPHWLIFDKTPFLDVPEDIPSVQRVSPRIYNASYPLWVFSSAKFFDFLARHGYRLKETLFVDKADMYRIGTTPISWQGYLFIHSDSQKP